jgi:hypothetical protein
MTTNVEITKQISDGSWVVSVTVLSGSDLPNDVFAYENTGTGLGPYFGVVSLPEYERLSRWEGVPVPIFGNKYLKDTSARVAIPLSTDPTLVIDKITKDLRAFRAAFLAVYSSTQIVAL